MPKKEIAKKIVLGVAVLLILAVIIFLQNPFQKKGAILVGDLQNTENTGIEIGNIAPDFILSTVGGNQYKLSNHRTKTPLVINFWASWCPPCREEFPVFEEIHKKNIDSIEIIGINLQESKSTIQEFKNEFAVTFPLLLDPDKNVKELYGVFTQPVTYFIDKEGIIVDKKFGPLTESELAEKLSKLGIN